VTARVANPRRQRSTCALNVVQAKNAMTVIGEFERHELC
jgi:hypothetical protein